MLLGCYRKGDANDPETYVAAIAAVLAEYPENIIQVVTDPRRGLPSKLTFLPAVAEVRQECENYHRPIRERMEWDRRARLQLQERDLIEAHKPPKQTYEETCAEMAARGMPLRKQDKARQEFNLDKFLGDHGASKAQWDAIPDAKPW